MRSGKRFRAVVSGKDYADQRHDRAQIVIADLAWLALWTPARRASYD